MIDSRPMLPKGVLVDRYRIDEYIASGGFGNTYKATHTGFNEVVAIKEFFIRGINQRDENSTTVSVSNSDNREIFDTQLKKFRKEAQRLRKMDNPHIVGVRDLFDANGTAYYVMDYVEGESLSALLKRTKKPLTEQQVRGILTQVLDALQFVHGKGIYHLDLKPANLMIDKKGLVRLIDFGASKQQSVEGGGATATTGVCYTMGFAPREQMEQNIDKFGPWTDLYALGGTLYNLLTMYKPPMPSVIDDDETSDKREALPMTADISQPMQKLIRWLMEYKPAKRPQNVEQVNDYMAQYFKEPEIEIPKKEEPENADEDITIAVGSKTVDDEKTMQAKWSEQAEQETQPIPYAEAVIVSVQDPEPKPQPQPKPKLESKPQPQPESKPQPKPIPKPEPKPLKHEPKKEPKPQKPDLKSQATVKVPPKPELKSEPTVKIPSKPEPKREPLSEPEPEKKSGKKIGMIAAAVAVLVIGAWFLFGSKQKEESFDRSDDDMIVELADSAVAAVDSVAEEIPEQPAVTQTAPAAPQETAVETTVTKTAPAKSTSTSKQSTSTSSSKPSKTNTTSSGNTQPAKPSIPSKPVPQPAKKPKQADYESGKLDQYLN